MLLTYRDSTVAATSLTAPTARQTPQRNPGDTAGQAKARGFAEERRKDAATRRAQGPQDADFETAPDDGNRNRVVDEERPDDQRDVAQHSQIPAKRRQHPAILGRFGAKTS